MSCCHDEDALLVDSNGCLTCETLPKVKGRFGLAWVSESPDCPNPEPIGWQVEFLDTPSKVEQKCQEMVRWINCPPLPRCDPCPPDELCCPSNPPRCNPCAPKCNPCLPKCPLAKCTCKQQQLTYINNGNGSQHKKKKCCCCQSGSSRTKRICYPPMGGPCPCRNKSPRRRSPKKCCKCNEQDLPKCTCDDNPEKDTNNRIIGSSSGTYNFHNTNSQLYPYVPQQVTQIKSYEDCICKEYSEKTLTLYKNYNTINNTDTEYYDENLSSKSSNQRKSCSCCQCNTRCACKEHANHNGKGDEKKNDKDTNENDHDHEEITDFEQTETIEKSGMKHLNNDNIEEKCGCGPCEYKKSKSNTKDLAKESNHIAETPRKLMINEDDRKSDQRKSIPNFETSENMSRPTSPERNKRVSNPGTTESEMRMFINDELDNLVKPENESKHRKKPSSRKHSTNQSPSKPANSNKSASSITDRTSKVIPSKDTKSGGQLKDEDKTVYSLITSAFSKENVSMPTDDVLELIEKFDKSPHKTHFEDTVMIQDNNTNTKKRWFSSSWMKCWKYKGSMTDIER